jgi:signal recognition particle subunit SRP14
VATSNSSLRCVTHARTRARACRCLIRATDGKRKISAAVSAADYPKFQASYGLILRAQMDALKKREKSKAKK